MALTNALSTIALSTVDVITIDVGAGFKPALGPCPSMRRPCQGDPIPIPLCGLPQAQPRHPNRNPRHPNRNPIIPTQIPHLQIRRHIYRPSPRRGWFQTSPPLAVERTPVIPTAPLSSQPQPPSPQPQPPSSQPHPCHPNRTPVIPTAPLSSQPHPCHPNRTPVIPTAPLSSQPHPCHSERSEESKGVSLQLMLDSRARS